MASNSLNTDMELHRKLNRVVKEAYDFCRHDLNSPRADYFNINQIMDMRRKAEIKLLVQVPETILYQIKEMI